jgi:hypothetical protein
VDDPTATKPLIPAEYGVPIDGSGGDLLPWSWAVEQLETARTYWICTTRSDGRPHTMPVWALWLDDAIWFSSGRASQKVRNLAANSGVVVHLESGQDVVIVEGEADEMREPEIFDRVADLYEAKYGMRPPLDSPLFTVRPRSAYTWRERDFPHSATRWSFG